MTKRARGGACMGFGLVLVCLAAGAAEPASEPRLNQIQVIGSHNSYHIEPAPAVRALIASTGPRRAEAIEYTHRPLAEQFSRLGIRQVELDLFADPKGGLFATPAARKMLTGRGKDPGPDPDAHGELQKPGLKILHVPDFDYLTTAPTFVAALKQIRNWSQANRRHVPILILLELKSGAEPGILTRTVPFDHEQLEQVETEILSVFSRDEILTPDRVRGGSKTLPDAIRAGGWPPLDTVRGLVCMFALDNEGAVRDRYLEGHPALENRLLFATVAPGHPAAAWFKINDPIKDFDRIRQLVREGFLVRTRADADTRQARKNDVTQRDKAFASGAQFISTDYAEPDRRLSDYSVRFAGGVVARTNPVSGVPAEKDVDLESGEPVKPADANPNPAPGRMLVAGRVLDPAGKPVPGAAVAVYARSFALERTPLLSRGSQTPIGEARADGSGRFRVDAPRTPSSHDEAFGAAALAPGYGVGWVTLDPDDAEPTADISLRPEQVIHGRLFDVQGRPAPEVTVWVASIYRDRPQAPNRIRNQFDGVAYSQMKADRLPAWPEPMVTDPEGRFTLRGVARDVRAVLTAYHPRFALQRIPVENNGAPDSRPLTAALAPAQTLNVRVTYADTGKPVARAPLEIMASRGRVGLPAGYETGVDGRLRVNSWPADGIYNVWAYPPAGEPYLVDHKRIDWPKAALEQPADLALPRGVLIHGKVTEEGSGTAIPGATVDFRANVPLRSRKGYNIVAHTASDGSFRLGVAPVPGCLFVRGPSDDYILREVGSFMLERGQPGGSRIDSHAHSLLDLKPGTGSQEVNFVLRRGATVTGHVVGPDGRPIVDAWMFSRAILDPKGGVWRNWSGRYHRKVRDGRFEIHGLDPESDVPVYFLEPKAKLGVVVNVSAKSAARGPVTVRLEPCGAAKARIVDAAGKPVAGGLPRRTVTLVLAPGPVSSRLSDKAGSLFAVEESVTIVDPVNYGNELAADADGRLMLSALIPGAKYRFIDFSARPVATDPVVRIEFTVNAGETIDLGDIQIAKPPG